MKVALISLDQKWEDKPDNLARCDQLASKAAHHGAELVIFPEMTLTGFSMDTQKNAEQPDDSPTFNAFQNISTQNQIHIVFGLALKHGDKAANTLMHVSPAGQLLARYTKIHPFTFAGEDQFFVRGNDLAVADIGQLIFGYTICYDLRFPEIYSALASQCNVIVNIANWPKRRVHHWRALLQARAIENQTYVIGVNRVGTDGNGLEYEKSSGVFNANGELLVPFLSEAEIDIFDIDYASLHQFKESFNTFRDRLPSLYRSLI